uniref:Calmodulin n=1 Tax=Phaeomonas parva TaxID=124430 RepID=A0A7S1UM27_9STRA|mmetsp:Transcript_8650/g.25164  ORF Transcript_8650/g.25164 Transcript_8650/m.25164 type:complete len:504 (+) Transcript_8650:274-1785(+)|eukprot:CAMPEP_0118867706 /NCGR_PEP_ID=MMETSP1163-20130328/11213_1 /TAXON_ID=124430 /ORGANISM="Phaeomonas parva, Strain CCMP2877" /LENGTH=503 /DNA_ID=CAMNT_0006802149 /DNA_START=209 /DNA_END=1720 /DNA_ORIENTATION=+
MASGVPQGIERLYEVGKVLGTGAFSTVREGKDRRTGQLVALKIISASKLTASPRVEQTIRNEISIMRMVSQMEHNCLVKMYDLYEDETKIVLVLEHLAGGELFDRIVERGHYTESDASQLTAKLMGALKNCHEQGILHRDMKPENCIYDSRTDDANIKITDFGLALVDDNSSFSNRLRQRLVGTPGYVAPEVLDRFEYTPGCDVWGIGVILYILLVGYPPFWAETQEALFAVIKRGQYEFHADAWDEISDEAKDLVSKMLTVDTTQRITSQGVLEHPWIVREQSHAPLAATQQRMRRFNARRKFRAAVMACFWGARMGLRKKLDDSLGERGFTPQELGALKECFNEADADGSGTVNHDQFTTIMVDLGFGDLPLDRMYAVMDKDDSNTIDYREFLCGLSVLRVGGEDAMRFCFDLYDADKSGFISREELSRVLFTVVHEEASEFDKASKLAEVFDRLDTNNDNKISFDEFKAGVDIEPALYEVFLSPMREPVARAAKSPRTED